MNITAADIFVVVVLYAVISLVAGVLLALVQLYSLPGTLILGAVLEAWLLMPLLSQGTHKDEED